VEEVARLKAMFPTLRGQHFRIQTDGRETGLREPNSNVAFWGLAYLLRSMLAVPERAQSKELEVP
jgi:hypothetical protein